MQDLKTEISVESWDW